ncbi:fatty acid desaturase [uncultured Roseobacter sp.]|uniref:fatty acid desaturase n=1 Tax=uncultured Roseobacter sp. TaxID=114847 RepID=UPI002632F87B|nr:fatty acid desaturase [uncultured Roseobacter sp.]
MATPAAPGLRRIEWPTVFIAVLCYTGFALSTTTYDVIGPWGSGILLALSLTLYSSLNHEVLHGHPFQNTTLNTALVFPALGLAIPYLRFRDTHLAHHHDPALTDPYDDPESNFIDPAVWARWSLPRRALYKWNNTLLGRVIVGPAISTALFYKQDVMAIQEGNRCIRDAYIFHAGGLACVGIWWILAADMPFWLYLLCAYVSLSVLKIRTFLEHRAHEKARCRSVIIEDRGLLSFLFLKNNLHAVHHAFPRMPWYQLQPYYAARRAAFLERNGGYAYRSYRQIAYLFLLKAKDPVPHSLWDGSGARTTDEETPKQSIVPGQ